AAYLCRWFVSLIAFALADLGLTAVILAYDNPMPVGSYVFWKIAQSRITTVLVIAVVAAAHSFATVPFHTVTFNRIVTPSILGFEALYGLINTAAVFFLGAAG